MILIVRNDSKFLLYDLSGSSITDAYDPGHEVYKISLSPRVDEVIISSIGSDNYLKIFKLENRRIKIDLNDTY